jgi:hypothetical protein
MVAIHIALYLRAVAIRYRYSYHRTQVCTPCLCEKMGLWRKLLGKVATKHPHQSINPRHLTDRLG